MEQLEEILFAEALNSPAGPERDAFLDRECANQPELKARVVSLLDAYSAGEFLESPAAAAPPTELFSSIGELPGTMIGPYKIRERIGEGGFGVVYVAEQEKPLRRKVALKLIKPGMDSRQVIARFEAERQALALMDHPNIARVLDAGTTGRVESPESSVERENTLNAQHSTLNSAAQRPFFVMELVHGVPITKFCDSQKLSVRDRLMLFVDVCRAVQHAHQKGIIHRDLKPSNILVTMRDDKPIVKVIDFGVAKALHQPLTEKTVYTAFGQLIGTPMYMSPEQAQMNELDVDTRSDVYSLGVLLYELLTGLPPFDRETIRRAGYDELRRMIQEREPQRPSVRLSTLQAELASTVADQRQVDQRRLKDHLRGELDWIVMKALEKDRNRRYESASRFADDVEHYLNDEPVEACPPSRAYRIRKFVRRHHVILTTSLLVTAALLSGSSLAVWHAVRATEAEQVANEQRDRAQASELEVRRMLYAADVRLAADAWQRNDMARMRDVLRRQLPQEGQPDFRGFEWHYLWKQTGMESQVLVTGESALYFACFSPDARWLAVTGADAVIRLFDGNTFALAGTIESGQVEVNGLAFSPDSQTLASAGDDGSIILWDPLTRRRKFDFHAHEVIAFQVAWSPDGSLLASCGKEPVIRLWDSVTGEPRGTIQRHTDVVEAITISPQGLLAAASNDRAISLWQLDTQECLLFEDGPSWTSPECVALSRDGRFLADGRHNAIVTIHDLHDSNRVFALHTIFASVNCLAFSPDSRWLAVGDDGGDVSLIPVQTEMNLRTSGFAPEPEPRKFSWHAHEFRVYALSFAPDGRHLVTGGKDGRAICWSLGENESRKVLNVAAKEVVFEADGTLLTAGEELQRLPPGAASAELLDALPGPWLRACVARQTGTIYARHKASNEVYAWSVNGEPLGSRWHIAGQSHTGPIAVSPDESRLAVLVLDEDDVIHLELIDTASKRVLTRIPAGVSSIEFSADGNWLAFSRSADVIILDAVSGEIRHTLAAHQLGANGVAFSPDSQHLATVGGDRYLNIWDVADGQREWSVVAHAIAAVDVIFSPDGQTLATIGRDGMLRFWRWGVERLLLEVPLPAGDARQIEFSPDGRKLVCRYGTGEVIRYDAAR